MPQETANAHLRRPRLSPEPAHVTFLQIMNKPKPIDFNQRPDRYWNDEEVLVQLLRNIKGAEQRSRFTKHWGNGDIEKLETEMDADGSEGLEQGLMPGCMPWEKEIAVMTLDSVNGDTISVRAIKSKDRIRYKVLDEYGSHFNLQREVSDLPLTLQEMINFLDQTTLQGLPGGISLGYNRMNAEYSSRAELRHFTSIKSQLYPDLKNYYQQVFEVWSRSEKG